MRTKYNFIVAFGFGDVYETAFKQLDSLEYASFFNYEKNRSALNRIIVKIALYQKIPLFLRRVFIWMSFIYEKRHLEKMISDFKDKTIPICFVFSIVAYSKWEDYGFFKYLRNRFKNCRIVYYCADVVRSFPEFEHKCRNNTADLIVSYDINDAKKYKMEYYPVPFSDLDDHFLNQEAEYDVCFVGAKKRRFNKIIEAFEYFRSNGLNCAFYITGCGEDEKSLVGINYCDFMNYTDYLLIESKSKCILEVMQDEDCYGNTFRVPEAIFMNKRLISNNKNLLNQSYYSDNFIVYENIQDINIEAIKNEQVDYPLYVREMFLPERFLGFIEEKLCNKS